MIGVQRNEYNDTYPVLSMKCSNRIDDSEAANKAGSAHAMKIACRYDDKSKADYTRASSL
jgi:hypothetical protein